MSSMVSIYMKFSAVACLPRLLFIWNPVLWHAFHANCLYVASIGTFSSVNSPLGQLTRNSSRTDSCWDVLLSPDLPCDSRVLTAGWYTFYLFIYDSAGSSLLRVGFSLVVAIGGPLQLQWLLLLQSMGSRGGGLSSFSVWAP